MKKAVKQLKEEPLSGEKTLYESVSRPLAAFASYIRHGVQTVRKSLFILILSTITAVGAGLFLSHSQEIILLVPGIIILLPGALSMRGAIYGALGARIGSALHMGYIKDFSLSDEHIRRNIYSTITQNVVDSVLLAFFAKTLAALFGFTSISLFELVAISFLGGIIAGLILLFVTFIISIKAFQHGWDPDNINPPMITTLGDFITIPTLLIATNIVLESRPYVDFIAIAIIAATLVNLALLSRHEDRNFRKAVFISIAVISLSGAISSISGTMLHLNIEKIIAVPSILIMLPAFLALGGNIGNIMASRLGTKLHMGQLDPELRFDREIKNEFFSSYILAAFVFSFLAVATHIADTIFHIPLLGLKKTLLISLFAGLSLTTLVIMTTFFVSILSYKHNIDPDDVTIPITTALADVSGSLMLIVTLGIFGVI